MSPASGRPKQGLLTLGGTALSAKGARSQRTCDLARASPPAFEWAERLATCLLQA